MKKLLFVALFLFTTFIYASDLGIKKSYLAGEYDSFLNELQAKYEKAIEEGSFAGIIDKMFEGQNSLFKNYDLISQYEEELKEKLSALAKENPDHALTPAIEGYCKEIFSEEEKKKVDDLESLYFKDAKLIKSDLEKTIVEANKELMIKTLIPAMEKPGFTQASDEIFIIELDHLLKLRDKSQRFSDEGLYGAIELKLQHFPEIVNGRRCFEDLQMIAKKEEPADSVERKVKELHNDFQKNLISLSLQ